MAMQIVAGLVAVFGAPFFGPGSLASCKGKGLDQRVRLPVVQVHPVLHNEVHSEP